MGAGGCNVFDEGFDGSKADILAGGRVSYVNLFGYSLRTFRRRIL